MYDFIGDIHGHRQALEALLEKLGYKKIDDVYQHAERTVFFLGDFIDRGPDNPGVVKIAKAMVEAGSAKAIMGNHEYNAILYNTKGGEDYFRKHTPKNRKQHQVTLDQYVDKPEEYQAAIEWFKTLPVYYEEERFRAIHACWHGPALGVIKKQVPNAILSEEAIATAADKSTAFHKALEIGLKGLETHLPHGLSFRDKDGHKRQAMRIKWWLNPTNKSLAAMSVLDDIKLPDEDFGRSFEYYSTKDKPVFFGHYWLKGKPRLQTPNVCCLDFSVAKGGHLCAYRWQGEQVLDESNFVFVSA